MSAGKWGVPDIAAAPLIRATILALLLVAGAPAAAQYPQRPVTIVVPFPAGGATDLIARLMANELQAKPGQPFVVESRPGARTPLAAAAPAPRGPCPAAP